MAKTDMWSIHISDFIQLKIEGLFVRYTLTASYRHAAVSETRTWAFWSRCHTWESGSRTWEYGRGWRSFHCVSLLPWKVGGPPGWGFNVRSETLKYMCSFGRESESNENEQGWSDHYDIISRYTIPVNNWPALKEIKKDTHFKGEEDD